MTASRVYYREWMKKDKYIVIRNLENEFPDFFLSGSMFSRTETKIYNIQL